MTTRTLEPSVSPQRTIDAVRQQLRRALHGKDDACDLALACLLARGHLLIEDAPGLGKTTLAKALADLAGGRFARIQCTPDLLPTDISGFTLFNQQTREFEFRPGPVFADVLLTDEINRATPRTQSALLEAMSERQVTIDDTCHRLSPSFFVVATQNPVEHLGTYPLPEAQLDRFTMKIHIGHPERADEIAMLTSSAADADDDAAEPPLDRAGLEWLQAQVAQIQVAESVAGYIVDLGRACRRRLGSAHGPSPRALLAWQSASRAWAFLEGREHVLPDDVQLMASPVLGVRLGLSAEQLRETLDGVLADVAVPVMT
jgi:MoxR-like ATPase